MKVIFFILGLMSSLVVKSQSIKEQILENVSEIKSVNLNDDDFSDLEVIGDAIGKAKIVFLGEQDHGDATTFKAKTRLVKYLHEKKGFNVLAFESDFFNINKKSDEQKPIEDIEESIFPIWSNCVQVNPLFEYVKEQQKTNPLIISGFDCQIAQNYKDDSDRFSYLNTITEYIEKNVDVSAIENYQLFKNTLKDVIFFVKATEDTKAHFKKVDKSVQKKYFKVLKQIMANINNKETFLFRSLENAFYYARMAWKKSRFSQDRDTQMGKNILWLHKVKFPNEKIIIWAHSAHNMKEVVNKKGNKKLFFNNTSAGGYVCNRLEKDKVYNLGFISRIGETERVSLNIKSKKYKIKLPEVESVENWIYSKQYKYAFVNFNILKNTSEVFYMKGISHYSFKANWLEAFDGMFYIDEMFPCIREK